MTWLALWFALQAGIMPNDQMLSYSPNLVGFNSPNAMYASLDAELRAFNDHLFLGGSVKTEVQHPPGFGANFLPESSTYSFDAGVRMGGLEAGWLHVCAHPTVPYYSVIDPVINFDSGYDDFYIRFSGKVDIFGKG